MRPRFCRQRLLKLLSDFEEQNAEAQEITAGVNDDAILFDASLQLAK